MGKLLKTAIFMKTEFTFSKMKLADIKKANSKLAFISLCNWYKIAWNDEINNNDWRMFISGPLQTVYNMGRLDSQFRKSDQMLLITEIPNETEKKIKVYAAIFETEF